MQVVPGKLCAVPPLDWSQRRTRRTWPSHCWEVSFVTSKSKSISKEERKKKDRTCKKKEGGLQTLVVTACSLPRVTVSSLLPCFLAVAMATEQSSSCCCKGSVDSAFLLTNWLVTCGGLCNKGSNHLKSTFELKVPLADQKNCNI